MANPTAAFFDELRQRDFQPALGNKSGVVRIELAGNGRNERWFVAIDEGTVKVSKRNQAADATVRADRKLFDELVTGKVNAVTAVLRGAMGLEGDWNLLIVFQRLFPSPQ